MVQFLSAAAKLALKWLYLFILFWAKYRRPLVPTDSCCITLRLRHYKQSKLIKYASVLKASFNGKHQSEVAQEYSSNRKDRIRRWLYVVSSWALQFAVSFFPSRMMSFQHTYRTFFLRVVIVGESHEATVSQPNCVQDEESATSDSTTFSPETMSTTNTECTEIIGEINSTVTLRCETEGKGFAVCELVIGLIESNRISRNCEFSINVPIKGEMGECQWNSASRRVVYWRQ